MAQGLTQNYRRHALGGVGLILLAVGVYFWIFPPAAGSQSFLQGSCIKSGLVLSAAWLAFPKIDQVPTVLYGSLVVVLMFVAFRPALIPILLKVAMIVSPVLVLIWMLRVKPKRSS